MFRQQPFTDNTIQHMNYNCVQYVRQITPVLNSQISKVIQNTPFCALRGLEHIKDRKQPHFRHYELNIFEKVKVFESIQCHFENAAIEAHNISLAASLLASASKSNSSKPFIRRMANS